MKFLYTYNPNDLPEDDLPIIYGFNNGGSDYFLQAIALSEEGEFLGSHLCSDEAFMPGDLALIEQPGWKDDLRDSYRAKYPNGYRTTFISYNDVPGHPQLSKVLERARAKEVAE